MTPFHLLLILLSACVHVVAHVAIKRTQDRLAFVWWMLLVGSAAFAPLAVARWQPVAPVTLAVLLPSASCEVGYFVAIARAYRLGDLSLVYPLARGTAPLLLAVWALLFLGERPTAGGLLGIAAIAGGLWVINLPGPGAWTAPFRAVSRTPAARRALLAGACTSLYTALDRVGVRQVDAWVYTWLVLLLTCALLTPVVLWPRGWSRLRDEWRASGRAALVAGVTSVAAYGIVLVVMQDGAPASYVGAAREVSVVLGAAIGVVLLRERGSAMRLPGSLLVVAGVVSIRLLG